MEEVDPAFIQATEHRPKPYTIEAEGIPVIDLSALSSCDSTSITKIVSEIGEACKNWGFFQVINHGVPLRCRQAVDCVAREFFKKPLEEKRKVKRNEKNPTGYYDGEYTKNVRDWKEVFDFVVEVPTSITAAPDPDDKEMLLLFNQWPQDPPNFREACEEYTRETKKLAFKLLGLISLSLGLPENRFNEFFNNHTSMVRFNYYPSCSVPHLALGVGRHKDACCLTVLSQDDVGGLEVKRKTDGEWIRVKPTPDAYIVNVGDIIQVWSNGKYESMEHRATVNSEKERFTIPFLLFPSHTTMVEPVEELVNEQNPAKYRAFNWGKFSSTRNISNFKKLEVENIQIYHFKIDHE